jgi:hypothetical protein
METETILWSKHVIILAIPNFKLILAILLHQRPLVVVGCHAHLLSENVFSREGTCTFSVIPKENTLSQ